MFRWVALYLLLIFAATSLSGCGIGIVYPDECQFETPSTKLHDFILGDEVPNRSAKEEFLNEWGTPDDIEHTSETTEIWTYKRSLWCGLVPIIFFVPVPLVVPLCDGFDRILFVNEEAVNLHIRKSVIFIIPGKKSNPVCVYPNIIDKTIYTEENILHKESPPNKSQERTE